MIDLKNELSLSDTGLKALINREGSRRQLYYDSAKNPTIGVGHLMTQSELSSGKIWIDGKPVGYRNGLSEQHISALLQQDIEAYENAVLEHVDVPLTQNQFDALVSFVFNIGIHAFTHSTLLKKLNTGDYEAVPVQMRRWIYINTHDGKRRLTGLINRREQEVKQWITS